MAENRLAVLFPGIGYHCDKPLLYYSQKLARSAGYQVLTVPYGGFPEKVRGDRKRLLDSVDIAWTQTKALLSKVDWAEYGDLLFIGKSIGTIAASRYAMKKDLRARSILLTPLKETFDFIQGNAVAFHGTADPWADTPTIEAACRERGLPLHLTENANHSLETGDALRDVQILHETLRHIRDYMEGRPTT